MEIETFPSPYRITFSFKNASYTSTVTLNSCFATKALEDTICNRSFTRLKLLFYRHNQKKKEKKKEKRERPISPKESPFPLRDDGGLDMYSLEKMYKSFLYIELS